MSVRSTISTESADRDRKWSDYILRGPRNLREERFQAQAISERATLRHVKIEYEDGNELEESQMEKRLIAAIKQLLCATEAARTPSGRKKKPTPIEQFVITHSNGERTLERVSIHPATEP